MRSGFLTALGIVALGVVAGPADGQAVRVEVGVITPPVAARVVVGRPVYPVYRYPATGVWITNAHLAHLHRRHMAWLAREQARLDAMRYRDRRYWQAVRAFERERLQRERELERAYQRWLHDRERDARHGHRR
jgi:hypothetical protein